MVSEQDLPDICPRCVWKMGIYGPVQDGGRPVANDGELEAAETNGARSYSPDSAPCSASVVLT